MIISPEDLSPDQLFLQMKSSFGQEKFWPRFSHPAFLYWALHLLVQRQSLPDAAVTWVDECEKWAIEKGMLDGWHAARVLVRCAAAANGVIKNRSTQNPPPEGGRKHQETDAAINSMASLPLSITELMVPPFPPSIRNAEDYKKFARGCIHSFHCNPYQRTPIRVPVVSWNKEDDGNLATLVLETLETRDLSVYQHPIDAFTTSIGGEFKSSMENAWSAAESLLDEEASKGDAQAENARAKPISGRWRFLQGWHPVKEQKPNQKDKGKIAEVPVSSVDGGSAGAAAAWGWYHALRGTAYDQRVIVSAVIDHNGKLSGVEGIAAKVRAIVADKRLDTIVVASTQNKNEAVETLRVLSGRNIEPKKEKPSEDSPGCKYFVPLTDGRELKIVNLDPDDPCATEKS